MSQIELIAKHITQDPSNPGPDLAVLEEQGVPIWVIAAFGKAANWDLGRLADTYGISQEAAAAAHEYYVEHRELIDCRIAVNQAAFA